MIRFFLVFITIAFVGFLGFASEFFLPIIDYFCLLLAKSCYLIIQPFSDDITLSGKVLRQGTEGFALEIAADCAAHEVTWLLVSAILSLNIRFKYTLLGVIYAVITSQAMNILRLISLFYIGSWISKPHFDILHEYGWPIALHLYVMILFVLWLSFSVRRSAT